MTTSSSELHDQTSPLEARLRLGGETLKRAHQVEAVRAANDWFELREELGDSSNSERERPLTAADVEDAERAMLQAFEACLPSNAAAVSPSEAPRARAGDAVTAELSRESELFVIRFSRPTPSLALSPTEAANLANLISTSLAADEPFVPGYHLAPIAKGVLGEPSKIQEELDELKDAFSQNDRILMSVELADLYGAMELFLEKHLPGMTMADVAKFHTTTRRAFENGRR